MARNFTDVVEAIKGVAPTALKEALEDKSRFWAPEIAWEMLSEMVNKYVTPSSTDATSVAVYAKLCNCTEAEMKARFEADHR